MRTLTPSAIQSAANVAKQPQAANPVDQLRLQMLTALQTQLELEGLLSLYASHINTLFNISGLVFIAAEPEINLSIGETALHHCNYKISTDDTSIGELCLYSRKRISDTDLMLIEVATSALVYPLKNALQYRDALVKAHRDPLTSLGNRLAMNAALKREVSRAVRHQSPLSVLMIDIDHFKAINDQYGHATGDRVLASVAEVLKSTAREADNAFRFGGEEFLILLDGTDSEGARVAAERLRQQVANQQPNVEKLRHNVTVSVGCATMQSGDSVSQLTERADAALYLAKSGGRNCVRVA